MSDLVVLSCITALPVLRAWQEGHATAVLSLDLGLTTDQVHLGPTGIILPDGHPLAWEVIHEIAKSESTCFEVVDGEAIKIQAYSEELSRFYSLMPTAGAPTLLVSGIAMHRIKGIDPHQDTLRKIRALGSLRDAILDTCTGLGYTAVEAARTAEHVVTIELDPTILEIARKNPWSRSLFQNPRIQQIVGDTFEILPGLDGDSFSRIVHDPPVFSLAGELYSAACYRELHRVLQRGGRMYHDIGDLSSRSGRNVVRGVVRRLKEAGFSRVVRRPEAFGVVAYH